MVAASLSPGMGRNRGPRLVVKQAPLFIELKPGAEPVHIKQYPMTLEAREGITPHIKHLLDLGILRQRRSPWNTLLPVKKSGTGDYWPVQDLREVNDRTMDTYPTVPNPYTLLLALTPTHVWYTILELKDAFFSLPLAPKNQEVFAFEWIDESCGITGQLTWHRRTVDLDKAPSGIQKFDYFVQRGTTLRPE